MKFKIKLFAFSIFSISFILCGCNDDDPEVPEVTECKLPYVDLELIGESELPTEIVAENYANYQNIDSLNGFTLELCDFGRHLVVQIVSTLDEHNFTIYDTCSVNVANGMFIEDSQLEDSFELSIKNELNESITLLDLAELNFNDGVTRYIAEIRDDGEEPRYLLDKNGKIICKLF